MSKSDKTPEIGCIRSGLTQVGPDLPSPLISGECLHETWDGRTIVLTEDGAFMLEKDRWVALKNNSK